MKETIAQKFLYASARMTLQAQLQKKIRGIDVRTTIAREIKQNFSTIIFSKSIFQEKNSMSEKVA
jgi:hypothetical protein